MGDLRILTLIESNNLPFMLTLDPSKNPDGIVLCLKLEELVIYVEHPHQFHVDELLSLVEEREARDAKLSAITVVSMDMRKSPVEVLQLGKHASRVECKFDNALPPAWNTIP